MRFLLDTNLISEIRLGASGNAGVQEWARSQPETDFALSVVTIKELEYGVLRLARTDARQSLALRLYLDHFVIPRYEDRILSVDRAVAVRAAALDVPDRRPVADGLIAATALVHNLTVVTRNTVDFRSTGAPVLNPFV